MSARFDVILLPLAGLVLLQRKPLGDARGYLERMWCMDELQTELPGQQIVQINHTLTTKRGTVRGMHFQWPPHAETKAVSCLRGEVFDVAVDLRRSSPTFLQWHGEILSEDNHRTLVIPAGFAHGFQTLCNDCELLYFHTAFFDAASEGALNAADPQLAIAWPLPITDRSARDAAHPLIETGFVGVAS